MVVLEIRVEAWYCVNAMNSCLVAKQEQLIGSDLAFQYCQPVKCSTEVHNMPLEGGSHYQKSWYASSLVFHIICFVWGLSYDATWDQVCLRGYFLLAEFIAENSQSMQRIK